MKKSIIIILLLINVKVFGIGYVIQSFELNASDLSASTSPRLNNDGKNCALIRVMTVCEGLKFEGNIVGEIITKPSEYWVYMAPGSEYLIIQAPDITPITLFFSEHEIESLESKRTYTLRLEQDLDEFHKTYIENYTGINNGHKYVDLGLSVKWALCNVGANSPEQAGEYYAWGETKPKRTYSWNTYIQTASNKYNKILSEDDDYDVISNALNDKEYHDAANEHWGQSWRSPTAEEVIELILECTIVKSNYNNVEGYVVTGLNGHSIFLPIHRIKNDQNNYDADCDTGYWTKNDEFLIEGEDVLTTSASFALVSRDFEITGDDVLKCCGLLIRPVIK